MFIKISYILLSKIYVYIYKLLITFIYIKKLPRHIKVPKAEETLKY